ncbi:hypothetical protein SteCoe_30385 [Stentor coeruleus]|uniref:LITAF domain-containing protein n=1 Tax=Stentor coeruleus TaxID=5963 RepID=A0A1R2B3Q5_9CILI|nr:hypothetical protein SteCoe_30385 [Stentor coeruleus]
MKAGPNKENFLPKTEANSQIEHYASPERKAIQKVLRFEQERTPDRPIHKKIPSLISKDHRNGLKTKLSRKKSMEINHKVHSHKNSPFSSALEMKSSIASTDVRGLSLFSSEVECKKDHFEPNLGVKDSITEKLACESFCDNCQKYVYTRVVFNKNSELDFICCFKELIGCCSNSVGQEIHHLCSKCNKLIWKIGLDNSDR